MAPLTYAQLEGVWIAAGGDPTAAATMAAIAYPESGANPGSIQQGQPYATTGWGLWQITPGNSVPSVGVNQALLDPFTNARAAVAKYNASKTHTGNGFRPWTTYTSGKYRRYLQQGVTPTTIGVNTSGNTGSLASAVSNPASSSAGGSGSGQSTPQGSQYNPSSCLIGFSTSAISTIALGLNGGNPNSGVCLFSKSEARALIGGLILATGGIGFIASVILLIGSYDSLKTTVNRVTPTGGPTSLSTTLALPTTRDDTEQRTPESVRTRPVVTRNALVAKRKTPTAFTRKTALTGKV